MISNGSQVPALDVAAVGPAPRSDQLAITRAAPTSAGARGRLNTFQPADEATTTWRDEFVDALENGDMDSAALQIDALASGGVTLTAC